MVNYGIVGAGYFGADLARSMNKIEDAKGLRYLTQITEKKLLKSWDQMFVQV